MDVLSSGGLKLLTLVFFIYLFLLEGKSFPAGI